MSKGEKISDLRSRKRLEQQAIDVVRGSSGAAVKPVSPAEKKGSSNK